MPRTYTKRTLEELKTKLARLHDRREKLEAQMDRLATRIDLMEAKAMSDGI